MDLHANAALSLNRRRLLCRRVVNHAAERVARQHVGARNRGGPQQHAKIENDVARAARYRDRVAAAQLSGEQVGARAVVGADAGKPRDRRQHRAPRPGWRQAPDLGDIAGAGLEHDCGATSAAALEVELATAANRDTPGELAVRRGRRECPAGLSGLARSSGPARVRPRRWGRRQSPPRAAIRARWQPRRLTRASRPRARQAPPRRRALCVRHPRTTPQSMNSCESVPATGGPPGAASNLVAGRPRVKAAEPRPPVPADRLAMQFP